MKKDIIKKSLLELESAPVPQEGREEEALVTKRDIEEYKRYFGAKWDSYAKRGNPYGAVRGIQGHYKRATIVMYEKQIKALETFSKEEGLTFKEALEITTEIGLNAIWGKRSEDMTVTEEDRKPKFVRKKKRRSTSKENKE